MSKNEPKLVVNEPGPQQSKAGELHVQISLGYIQKQRNLSLISLALLLFC